MSRRDDLQTLTHEMLDYLRREPRAMALPHKPIDPSHLSEEAQAAWDRLRTAGEKGAFEKAESLAVGTLALELEQRSPASVPDHAEIALEHRRLLENKVHVSDLPAVRQPMVELYDYLQNHRQQLDQLGPLRQQRPVLIQKRQEAHLRLVQAVDQHITPLFKYPARHGPKLRRLMEKNALDNLARFAREPDSVGPISASKDQLRERMAPVWEAAQQYSESLQEIERTDTRLADLEPLEARAKTLERAVHRALDRHMHELNPYQRLPDILPEAVRQRFVDAQAAVRRLPQLTTLLSKLEKSRAWPEAQTVLIRALERAAPSEEDLKPLAKFLPKNTRDGFVMKMAKFASKTGIGVAVSSVVRVATT